MSFTVSIPVVLCPTLNILASLCSLVKRAIVTSVHNAQRIPFTLLAEIEIPMVDGSKEKYKIPDGTQPGTKFTIRNKGFKNINNSSQGNFVFTVLVQVPKRLTKEQRELLVELAKTMNEQPPVKKRGLFG